MSLAAKIRRAPLRATTGAYILNAGMSKFNADDDTSKAVHGMASGAFPLLDRVDHKMFVKLLSVGEMSLGAALLLPVVPPAVAGLGLCAFAGSLLTVWWRTPGMHQEGSIRPTQQGTPIAKDVWMFGAGAALVLDALTEPAHDKTVAVSATVQEKAAMRRRQARKARKAAMVAGAATAAQVAESARRAQSELAERAREASEELGKRAKKASRRTAEQAQLASERLAELREEYGPVVAEQAHRAQEVSKRLAETAVHSAKEIAETARQSAKEAAETARHSAKDAAETARHSAKDAAQTARESAQDLADKVSR
jgi:uncharacterized membrane protein YphA (DoxX/SURF4 family)